MSICSPYAGGGAAGCCANAGPTTGELPSNSEMNNTLRIVILPDYAAATDDILIACAKPVAHACGHATPVSIDWFPTDASVQSASGKRRLAAAILSQMTAPMILATFFGAMGRGTEASGGTRRSH